MPSPPGERAEITPAEVAAMTVGFTTAIQAAISGLGALSSWIEHGPPDEAFERARAASMELPPAERALIQAALAGARARWRAGWEPPADDAIGQPLAELREALTLAQGAWEACPPEAQERLLTFLSTVLARPHAAWEAAREDAAAIAERVLGKPDYVSPFEAWARGTGLEPATPAWIAAKAGWRAREISRLALVTGEVP
jgi:hypothetical protein